MAVYGEIRSKSVNEKNTIINQDSYGQSKFIMENI